MFGVKKVPKLGDESPTLINAERKQSVFIQVHLF